MTDSRQGESDAPSPLIPLAPSGFYTQCFTDQPLKCVATQIQLHHADVLVVLWKKERPPAVAFASSSINTWHSRVVSRSGGRDTDTLRITRWHLASHLASKEALIRTNPGTCTGCWRPKKYNSVSTGVVLTKNPSVHVFSTKVFSLFEFNPCYSTISLNMALNMALCSCFCDYYTITIFLQSVNKFKVGDLSTTHSWAKILFCSTMLSVKPNTRQTKSSIPLRFRLRKPILFRCE